jgi:hypothetical protein
MQSAIAEVYRVEDGLGQGPYASFASWPSDRSWDDTPVPYGDNPPIEDVTREEFFGFATLEQLAAWFGPAARAALASQGYRIGHYAAPRVRKGGKQVVFPKAEATRLAEIPLDMVTT